MNKVGIIVPTLNAGPAWGRWLAALASQTEQPAYRLVIDSSSDDDTAAQARAHGFDVRVIQRTEFNHGGTRAWGMSLLPDAEIVVFMTQDALLAEPDAIARLLAPFADDKVGAAYGRQLPHQDAKPIGAHARLFNYPPQSQLRRWKDRARLGIKTAFLSNSFAAYRRSALLAVGGFPSDTIMNEDTHAAAKMLMSGWSIAYCAEAQVFHSHDYGYGDELKRYFDIGVFHHGAPWLQRSFGKAEGEGLRFVVSELKYLGKHAPWLIPSALLRSALKWLGYKLGRSWQSVLPVFLKRRCSLHRAYWSRA